MATRPAKTEETGVVAQGPGAPPAELMEQLAGGQGRGVSTAQEDNQTPLVRVLQGQSRQVMRGTPEYIEGAQPGMIYLKNAPQQLINGEEGFDFQPCHFSKDVIEWTPRDQGGGFVARHPIGPGETADDVYKRLEAVNRDEGDGKPRWKMPNGNELVETRNHAGFILWDGEPLPFVIALSGSGLSVSREWMGIMNRKAVRGPDGKSRRVDSWACIYRFKTKFRQNAEGQWFVLTPDQGRWVQTREDLERGEALFQAFETGERRVADETGGVDEGAGGASSEERAQAAGV
jgi:hypothetical protein